MSRRFQWMDRVLLILMALPVLFGMALQVVTKPAAEGISITGARVFFTIPMPIQDFPVTESQVNSLLVLVTLFFSCLYLTHGLKERGARRRQRLAELMVETADRLVGENMGEYFRGFPPFVLAILALSAASSLFALFGLFPPTADINVTGGWAALVFVLITYYKMKGGLGSYLKSFAEPVRLLTPINLISEVATPVSMAFRHYGNVLSGTVISVLLGAALARLSAIVLKSLPGFLADIPLFQIGIPAILSIYFDVFSAGLQAFIFGMLTMMYVSGAFPAEEYERRKLRKLEKTD